MWKDDVFQALDKQYLFQDDAHRSRFKELLDCYANAPFVTPGLCKCMYMSCWDEEHFFIMLDMLNQLTLRHNMGLNDMYENGELMVEEKQEAGSYEDQAIILADSGMLQSTAEKKHLLLTLWSGEWFENMQSQEIAYSASVPYRRETFVTKQIVLDFDGEFNMSDASSLTSNAKGKGLRQITSDIDSLNHVYDSIGKAYYDDAKRVYYSLPSLAKTDSVKAVKAAMAESMAFDSIYARLSADKKQNAVNDALNKTQSRVSDLEFRSMITSDGDKLIRQHKIEAINKFTLALQCLLFFFIRQRRALKREGGLGYPILISVLVFIIYYILDNSGYRMARGGMWAIWFGKGLAPAVLTPVAIFVTYKANNDSVVFNSDAYRDFFMKLLGLRL